MKLTNVDTEKMDVLLSIIGKESEKTYQEDVISGVGSFFAALSLPKKDRNFDLVTSVDGIGTKLELYKAIDNYYGVGYDLVAMVFNDIICSGAYPLFMLDYYSFKNFEEKRDKQIFRGLSEACKYVGASLVGGESAQLFTHFRDNFDIVGFGVGLVETSKRITGEDINEGDYVIGLKSNGFHCNGFTVINSFLRQNNYEALYQYSEYVDDIISNALVRPATIYVKDVHRILSEYPDKIKGMANITGGGYFHNIRRILPKGLDVNLTLRVEQIPGIIKWFYQETGYKKFQMAETFNMGVGFALITDIETANKIEQTYPKAFIAGRVFDIESDSCDGGNITIIEE